MSDHPEFLSADFCYESQNEHVLQHLNKFNENRFNVNFNRLF